MSMKTGIGVALFASLALNVFFVGGAINHSGPAPRGDTPFDRVTLTVSKLQQPARARAEKVLDKYRADFETQGTAMRTVKADLQATLQSETYTRAKGEKQFDAMEKQMDKIQLLMKNMMLDLSDTLPPQDRVKLIPQRPGGPR